MAVQAPSLHYSFHEYVRFEAEAHERHEFVGGLILAMAGGTLEHARRTATVIELLGAQLRGQRCGVFDANARVRVTASGSAYYPDASVICGQVQVDPEDQLSATNPIVLVEVLSPSTAEYDRTDKLADYQSIPSVVHVVHVSHSEHQLDVWTRHPEGWLRETWSEGERALLPAISCSLDVSEIYRDPLRG